MGKIKSKFQKLKLQLEMSKLLQTRFGLPRVAQKLKKKEVIKIGFLGGSITLAEGYRIQITNSLQAKYPQCEISGINGGIGGTGSALGVFRLYDDVLKHNPDLIFVEFAVNDCEHTTSSQSLAATEGIVRQIRQCNPVIDICFIYTINSEIKKALDAGEQYWTVTSMEKIADYYNIPSINLGSEVVAQEKSGHLIYQLPKNSEAEDVAQKADKLVFSYDSVHPTLDDGHGLYSKIIMMALDSLLSTPVETVTAWPADALSTLPWTDAKMISLQAVKVSKDWIKTTPEKENLSQIGNIQRLSELWKTNEPGAEIRFCFKGTGFGLFGLFGLNSGQFKVWIDGVEYPKASLFDKYGNRYRVHYVIIADSLPFGEHEAVLQLDSTTPDRSMLLPERKIDDPAKLEGLVSYISSLLIIGEIK